MGMETPRRYIVTCQTAAMLSVAIQSTPGSALRRCFISQFFNDLLARLGRRGQSGRWISPIPRSQAACLYCSGGFCRNLCTCPGAVEVLWMHDETRLAACRVQVFGRGRRRQAERRSRGSSNGNGEKGDAGDAGDARLRHGQFPCVPSSNGSQRLVLQRRDTVSLKMGA